MDAKTLVKTLRLYGDLDVAEFVERQAAELEALRAERDALLSALGEIAWSNDSRWQSARADAAINAARTGGGKP